MTQKGKHGRQSHPRVDFREKGRRVKQTDIFQFNINHPKFNRTSLKFKVAQCCNDVAKSALCLQYEVSGEDVCEKKQKFYVLEYCQRRSIIACDLYLCGSVNLVQN